MREDFEDTVRRDRQYDLLEMLERGRAALAPSLHTRERFLEPATREVFGHRAPSALDPAQRRSPIILSGGSGQDFFSTALNGTMISDQEISVETGQVVKIMPALKFKPQAFMSF